MNIPETIPVQVNREQLSKVMKRVTKGTASGPSSWSLEHMQALFFGSEQGAEVLLELINLGLAGTLPPWQEVRASRVVMLLKKGGGIRPIAIGEVLTRLMSMCAMAACPKLGPALAPLQVGVGLRGGAQCLGHAIMSGVLEHPDDAAMQLDFKNASNTLDRAAMLQAVVQRAPQLLRFVQWMYRCASPLWVAGSLWSKAGVRQGDPLGPLLFALKLQDGLHETQRWNAVVTVCVGCCGRPFAERTYPTLFVIYSKQVISQERRSLFCSAIYT